MRIGMHLGPFYASTSTRRRSRTRRKGDVSGAQLIGYLIAGTLWLVAACLLLPVAGVLACVPRTRPAAHRTLRLLRWS